MDELATATCSCSPSTPIRVAAVFLLRADGAALMQHRDDKPGLHHAGQWVPPGGHCEPDERIEDCARRELLEETAYDCPHPHYLTTVIDDLDPEFPAYQLAIFWARYDGIQPVRCLEGQALEFLRRQGAEAYPIPRFLLALWDSALAACSSHPATIEPRR
jgi:8-oxo-dGTP pyrophosphatase MutT (NUDIX family)